LSLGAKIRDLRLRKGESLQDVASAIGVSKTHVWELEKGRSKNPSMDLVAKLADHFQVTIASLVGEELGAEGGDEELMRMFRQAGVLSEEDRAVLDDMIQAMLKRRRERGASD